MGNSYTSLLHREYVIVYSRDTQGNETEATTGARPVRQRL